MADVTLEVGESRGFTVAGFNKRGKRVPLTDAVMVDGEGNIATAVVDADGNNGVATGVADGTTTWQASAAGLRAPLNVTVATDNTVASIDVLVAEAPATP